jgi:hypothetical protein
VERARDGVGSFDLVTGFNAVQFAAESSPRSPRPGASRAPAGRWRSATGLAPRTATCSWSLPRSTSSSRPTPQSQRSSTGPPPANRACSKISRAGEDTVQQTIRHAATPFCQPDGSYRFHNSFRYLIAWA